jgi:hypothetical protein
MHYGFASVNAQLLSNVTNLMKSGHTGHRRDEVTLIRLEVDLPSARRRIICCGRKAKT